MTKYKTAIDLPFAKANKLIIFIEDTDNIFAGSYIIQTLNEYGEICLGSFYWHHSWGDPRESDWFEEVKEEFKVCKDCYKEGFDELSGRCKGCYQTNFNRVMNAYKEVKPERWRAENGKKYWSIGINPEWTSKESPDLIRVLEDTEEGDSLWDDDNYNGFNYFRTKEQAEEARDAIKEVLAKLHDKGDRI